MSIVGLSPTGAIDPRYSPRVDELITPTAEPVLRSYERVRVNGKFFELAGHKWFVKGFTYGPFAPNSRDEFLPERQRWCRDFEHISELGGNAIRLYHRPPRVLLDDAVEHGLRVLVDVPWEKHRCFFEDYASQESVRRSVRETARALGSHPGLMGISVVNELPSDIVRFYGATRIERFIDTLLDTVRQTAPDCLATFANYPPTEFLAPILQDFWCFNVYLHDGERLGAYLDRLQHIAGSRPLILGEYGIDSLREGEGGQAEALTGHVRKVFARGLSGSFIFSYTDDWYTGGHQIEDWAFGVTTRDREEKPSARRLSDVWSRVPKLTDDAPPRVSVVVCSYNGAATLEECVASLRKLDYPDYEVILVDDGSKDNTPEIAGRFPEVRYIRQPNRGLSAARNVGAEAATGEIVAYTDSDCVADENWLSYLIDAMRQQQVEAIGGPNVPPESDGWTAQCVAASPGGPSHVMLDDRLAEHVPGCNMAFRRDKLLEIGGFDPQFRQAGDDADVCWRWLDAGMKIGYAPSALVWHHRRSTVKAYLRQQAGYGRAEAMLQFKYPRRFTQTGCSRWNGIIYGEGAVGLPTLSPVIYHGRFGSGLFQTIYRRNEYGWRAVFLSPEWHAGMLFCAGLSLLYLPLALVSAGMVAVSLVAAYRSSRQQPPLRKGSPWWCRPLIFGLHLIQPVVRGGHRYWYRMRNKSLPRIRANAGALRSQVKRVARMRRDLYWNSTDGRGREALLESLLAQSRRVGWRGDFQDSWSAWDAQLVGDWWHRLLLHTATEELGWPNRFTRARCVIRPTVFSKVIAVGIATWLLLAAVNLNLWGVAGGLAAGLEWLAMMEISRKRSLDAFTRILWRAGRAAGLAPVAMTPMPDRDASRPKPMPEEGANGEAGGPDDAQIGIGVDLREAIERDIRT